MVYGRTIRSARLPGAGEDLSRLSDWASCYEFSFYFMF